VFAPARFAERIGRCEVFASPPEARAASDHFPLLVELH
jgi:endonuclease/exonuclease/phosphatase family metal-dependent hydrolase